MLRADQDPGGYIKQGYHTADDKAFTSGAVYGRSDDKQRDWLLNGYYNDSNDIRLGTVRICNTLRLVVLGAKGKFGWRPDEYSR